MLTKPTINPLVAEIVNRELVIKRFRDGDGLPFDEMKLGYLEMAYVCICEYYSMIASGSTDYYKASKMLSKAAYAVRQANNVQSAKNRRTES